MPHLEISDKNNRDVKRPKTEYTLSPNLFTLLVGGVGWGLRIHYWHLMLKGKNSLQKNECPKLFWVVRSSRES